MMSKIRRRHFDDALEEVRKTYEENESFLEQLQEENLRLKSEHYKDEELQNMAKKVKEMNDDLMRGFPITKEEKEKMNQWKENHEKEKHSGEKMSYCYIFLPTVLGMIGTVQCQCKAEFNFQDIC